MKTPGARLLLLLWLSLASAGWCHANDIQVDVAELKRMAAPYGEQGLLRLTEWTQLMDVLGPQGDEDKVQQVNTFFNRVRFMSDSEHWGKPDYWATPLEFLASDGGDCEDFAIAKYFTLRALGLGADSMRLAYVKSLSLNQAHVVLVYYAGASRMPMILDNLVQDILPASKRTDLVPVYSFNGEGLWQTRQEGNDVRLGSGEDVLMWKELIQRIQAEKEKP